MPKRNDIKKILIVGSGPIVIGQACEFDYSGTQACKALRKEGFEVVLVNSNPATIMTDPDIANRTYIEPITAESVAKIIRKEKPDALLANMGGQTGLNCAVELAKEGVLSECDVEVIGCDISSIEVGEDRELFANAMREIGLEVARSEVARTLEDCEKIADELGYPVVLRPAFTLGGAGGGMARSHEELVRIASEGLALSPVSEVLVEQSVEGWKEIEMELMRDAAGNSVVVCSIENLDPMGVHTGDSITVAPCLTLNDFELQRLRDASIAIMEKVGIACGGSNVQFAVNPDDGRMLVIEMNPRVSRSSALASKATGFPIAKIAALLSVGYTLDEITNDITGKTPVCFEPSIDYCVVKIPRFAFEKFKGSEAELTTRMKAVGEIMAIGSTFEEALQKGIRSLEQGYSGLVIDGAEALDENALSQKLMHPHSERILFVAEALRRGWPVQKIFELSKIDSWFLHRIKDIVSAEALIACKGLFGLDKETMHAAKTLGFSDARIAELTGHKEDDVRSYRHGLGVLPLLKTVDTCAGEFEAHTNYHYFTYIAEGTNEFKPADKPRAIILSAGPNRIGQGIEFDYCCVHAAYTLKDLGYETVMVNCNPETVSTDYDTSDRLYFEPLTFEDVMNIVELEKPEGVVVTFGGQTPINLASRLKAAGVPIMGTNPEAIDLAEDRKRFAALLDNLGILYPPSSSAFTAEEAKLCARQVGYPLLVRPSYVLGGRGMKIVYTEQDLLSYMGEAAKISPEHPVYIDAFLEDAIEVDVDALCDTHECYVGAVLEHIEECGIHSGDSACCFPPYSLSDAIVENIRAVTKRLALSCNIKGLLNVQYAVLDDRVFVIELNPRASRTVPFSSKASGVSLARAAAQIMAGATIASLELPPENRDYDYFAVKEAVMPWSRFPGAEVALGPEMKSTGEVMGIDTTFPKAFAKTREAINYVIYQEGCVFLSVCDKDKRSVAPVALTLRALGFNLVATRGTAKTLRAAGIPCKVVNKISEGHPNVLDMIRSGEICFFINTPKGNRPRGEGAMLRSEAVKCGIDMATTMSGAVALVQAISALREEELEVYALQDLHPV